MKHEPGNPLPDIPLSHAAIQNLTAPRPMEIPAWTVFIPDPFFEELDFFTDTGSIHVARLLASVSCSAMIVCHGM